MSILARSKKLLHRRRRILFAALPLFVLYGWLIPAYAFYSGARLSCSCVYGSRIEPLDWPGPAEHREPTGTGESCGYPRFYATFQPARRALLTIMGTPFHFVNKLGNRIRPLVTGKPNFGDEGPAVRFAQIWVFPALVGIALSAAIYLLLKPTSRERPASR